MESILESLNNAQKSLDATFAGLIQKYSKNGEVLPDLATLLGMMVGRDMLMRQLVNALQNIIQIQTQRAVGGLSDLESLFKYMQFDLEATKRERDKYRKELEGG
jgi:hypothetical protein